jgi:hypothetical protein
VTKFDVCANVAFVLIAGVAAVLIIWAGERRSKEQKEKDD